MPGTTLGRGTVMHRRGGHLGGGFVDGRDKRARFGPCRLLGGRVFSFPGLLCGIRRVCLEDSIMRMRLVSACKWTWFLVLMLGLAGWGQNHWEIIHRSNSRCSAIQFVTPQIGWAANIYSLSPPSNYSLYKTTDGGYTWSGAIVWNPYIFSSHIGSYCRRVS
jgi:hypothetical protein